MSNDRPPATGKRKGLDGRVIAGRYRVTRTVAAGANTLIADAEDIELDRAVTIKLVRPELSESDEFRRAFRTNMETMAGLKHPNIAEVYDWGEERIGKRTTVFAVVEYLSGGSLRDLFDRGRHLTPSQALMVGLEACRGLDFAHGKGLVHTELTPSKLVFGDDRRLRIVDFGLARTLGEREWQEPSGVATHVARYASPEQAKGEALDGKTDVYSLALILVEAVTGRVPFGGDSTVATLSARIGKLMPVSADLGPLASVLERAGRPEAPERASAAQFGRALVRAAERMPRPTPIPILTSGLFVEDPSAMRRPDDPTGGIARPPATPEPAIIPPVPGGPVSTTDATVEIDGGGPAVSAAAADGATDAAAAAEQRTSPDADLPVSTLGVPTSAAPAEEAATTTARRGAAATETTAADTAAADVHDELAALVERTPRKPAPPDESVALTRRERRRRRKAAKRDAKAARKSAKKTAKSGRKPEAGQISAADLLAAQPDAAPRRRRVLPVLLALLIIGALGGIAYVAWLLFQTPRHEIPDVVGLPQDEAIELVDDFKWDLTFRDGRSDEFATPGQVISVSPPAGEDLAEGSPLLLEISEGPEYRQVPDLTGMTLAAAEEEIARLQLVALEPTEQFSESVPAGEVISAGVEGIPVGDNVLPGAQMNLVVSAGPQQRRVPQLRGLTVDQATQTLGELGLVLAVSDPVFDDEVPSGGIATQEPAAGTDIDRDATVTVAPSKGPDLVTMPDLTGRGLAEIGQLLNDAGLELGPLVGARSGTFYQAYVDGEQVSGGDPVRRGSQVSIIILVQ